MDVYVYLVGKTSPNLSYRLSNAVPNMWREMRAKLNPRALEPNNEIKKKENE